MLKIFFFWLSFFPLASDVPDSLDVGRSGVVYYKAQFAGNLGLISAGAGYVLPDSKIQADLSLGYLPKQINGVRVFTMSLKPAWNITEGALKNIDVGLYLGAAVNYSWGRNIFGSMPDYYPLDYYWPNAFRFNPFAGVRFKLNQAGKKSRTYFYAELGTVGYEVWFALKNRQVDLTDIFNLGFGIMVSANRTKTGKVQ